MVAPLLLALGLLAGNEGIRKYAKSQRDAREEEQLGKLQGLLGAGPGAMGPEDANGGMGYTAGRGLLADPSNVGRQLEFAAGVSGMRGMQAPGFNLLNQAMQRAQAQDQAQQQARMQQGQWDRQFAEQGRQYDQTYQAGRDDAAAAAARFRQTFGFQQGQDARQARQWGQEFELHRNADARATEAARLANAADGAAPYGVQKLPQGYGWVPGADGQVIAAPAPGTEDYAKATGGLATLQRADQLIGTMLDTMQGKEVRTPGGVRVRHGGTGTEVAGETAARLSGMRAQIISNVAKLRDMGVLQAGELERIEEQLPDPTGVTSLFKRNKSIAAGYDELRKQFRAKRDDHLKAHPWLVPRLPPGFRPVDDAGAVDMNAGEAN